ncbi:hypothetical protein GCM10012278_25150 [Nonomuraea glycinis]|uniref:Uncharacterized protein n=1 Tax=Nonomuraea glycinis TaxID=2047744 RepID=A0A918A461_9ACTN|nr:hypothetical protein GCM10012278_25150 [Nonomuraea glycinis]
MEIDRDELTNDLVIVYDQYFPKNLAHGGKATRSRAVTCGFRVMCSRTFICDEGLRDAGSLVTR